MEIDKGRQALAEFRSNSTLTKKLYDHTMEPLCQLYNISRMELDILLFLANNPEYDTAKDIIEQKRFTKSHVSSSLKLLEDKGYVTRSLHPGNRKTVHLTLLPASDEIVLAGKAAQKRVFDGIFSGLSPEEIRLMDSVFHKISANIRRILREEES